MENIKVKISENKLLFIIIVITFFLIMFLCKYQMFAQDEYNYSNVDRSNERVDSVSDIIETQINMYKEWTGRIPVSGLIQLFLYIGTPVYNVVNSLVFIVALIFICKVLNNKVSILQISGVLFLIVFAIGSFWEKFIWISGSLNYLWPVTAILIVMYYIYNIIINNKSLKSLEKAFLYFMSFFAGWSQENAAFVLGSFFMIIIVLNIKKILKRDNKISSTVIISTLLFGVGAILLIFAPGNFSRLGDSDTSVTFEHILNNFSQIKYLIIIYILTTVLALISTKSRDKILHQILYFMIPCGIALVPMLIIHEFPQRAMLAYEICFMICISNNIMILENKFNKNKKSMMIITYIVSISAISILTYKTWFAFKYVEPYKEEIDEQINYARLTNNKDVVLTKFERYDQAEKLGIYMDPFPKTLDISIINTYIARYYGFNSITALDKDTSMIEIILDNEEKIENYNLINKDTNQFVSGRILNTVLQMPNLTVKDRVIFIIPTSMIDKVFVDFPDVIKNKVKKVIIKDIYKTVEVDSRMFVK